MIRRRSTSGIDVKTYGHWLLGRLGLGVVFGLASRRGPARGSDMTLLAPTTTSNWLRNSTDNADGGEQAEDGDGELHVGLTM